MPRKLSKYEEEILSDLGLSPEEAAKLSHDELEERAFDFYGKGDAEQRAKSDKEAALAQQREGEAQYLARLQPLQPIDCQWVLSYTDLGCIDPETKLQMYHISICESPRGLFVGSKLTCGRPTVDDIKIALQVAMAFPMVGKGRRPYIVDAAWRVRDMWPELAPWLHEMGIAPRLQTREQAVEACAEAGTDIEGRNIPVPEQAYEELPPVVKLKNEGNRLFSLRRYPQAAEKYTEALEHDPASAVLFSNRAIAYIHMGLHTKALADAEEAIQLDPQYIKGHARKGQALEKLGRVDDARTHYQECINTLEHPSHFRDALNKLDAAQS